MTQDQESRRSAPRAIAEGGLRQIKRQLARLPEAERRECRRVLALARDRRSRDALLARAFNSGAEGPVSNPRLLAYFLVTLKGWAR